MQHDQNVKLIEDYKTIDFTDLSNDYWRGAYYQL